MKLIRSGMFETNSSSNHTCVICNEEEFQKWYNEEYIYINSKPCINRLIRGYSCDDAIHGDFFEAAALKKIPLSSICENIYNYVNTPQEVINKCKKFSIFDAYVFLIRTWESYWNDEWDNYCNYPVFYDDDEKDQVEVIECLRGINFCCEELLIKDLFSIFYESGFSPFNRIMEGYNVEKYIDESIVDGVKIIVVSSFGDN